VETIIKLLDRIIPNVMDKPGELGLSIIQTLIMTGISGIISFALGMVFGTLLVTTKPGGIMQNKGFYTVLDKVINIFRSIPFIILLAALIPLTRLIVGTAIGTRGAMVPLVIGCVPFFSRQMESALSEVDPGVIEAAQSMGSSPLAIVFRVYFRESIPSIIRMVIITIISLIGLTAMAGAVGGGGLGDFSIRYGHNRNQWDVTIVTVIILLIMVSIIQSLGSWLIKKTTH
jgi:D-methionine transport system permease protein